MLRGVGPPMPVIWAPDEAVAAARIPAPQRRAELDYLEALVHNQFSDREARYVPLEGTERRSLSMERALKSVRIETHALWQAFDVGSEPVREEDRHYDDVLDAYHESFGDDGLAHIYKHGNFGAVGRNRLS